RRSVRECKLLGRDAFPCGDQVIDLAGAGARATNVDADLRRLDAADIFDAAVLLHVGDGRLDGAATFTGRTGLHGHAAFSPFASSSKRSRHLGPYRRMAASTIKSWMTRLKLLCPASRASSSAARKTSGWALMFRRSAVRLFLMCASLCFTSNQQRPRAYLTAGHSKWIARHINASYWETGMPSAPCIYGSFVVPAGRASASIGSRPERCGSAGHLRCAGFVLALPPFNAWCFVFVALTIHICVHGVNTFYPRFTHTHDLGMRCVTA